MFSDETLTKNVALIWNFSDASAFVRHNALYGFRDTFPGKPPWGGGLVCLLFAKVQLILKLDGVLASTQIQN